MTSDGFHTTCTTCSTRLKVRDESAIGQIFGCPKCGSMVLVAPPEGMEIPAADDLASSEADATSTLASGTKPADWNSAAQGHAWLQYGVGTLAAAVLTGSVVAYAWLHRPTHEVAAVPPVDVETSVTQDENVAQQVADDVAAAPNAEASPTASDAVQPTETPTTVVTDNIDVDQIFDEVATLQDEGGPAIEAPATTNLVDSALATSIGTAERDIPPATDSATLNNLTMLLSGGHNVTEANRESDPSQQITAIAATKASAEPQSIASNSSSQKSPVVENLNRPIRAVRFTKVPLKQFLRDMMQLTGAAIQLDPDALLQTGNTLQTPVTVATINQSAMTTLQSALDPRNLLPVVDGNGVRITATSLTDSQLKSTSLFVGDLVNGNDNDLDLATLISTLIAPKSWSTAGGDGTIRQRGDRLDISNNRLITIRSLILLERLRAARGLKSRTRIPNNMAALPNRWAQLDRYLRRRISLNGWQETPWTAIIRELEDASGLEVLMDWKSLEQIGIRPESTTTLYLREQLLADVFSQLTESMNIGIVPVGTRSVQLTTISVASSKSYCDFYTVDDLSETQMSIVEQKMLAGAAAIDPVSGMAMVTADATTHAALSD